MIPRAVARVVLGIDPGTRHLGWGVVRAEGPRVTHVAHGVVHTDTEGSFADRLVTIDDALRALIAEHSPSSAGVESIFFSRDPQAAAKLGHARGVVLLALARAGVAIEELAPAHVKRAIVGRGAADKKQVAMIVTAILRLSAPPPADAADALAIAITHARRSGLPVLAAAQRGVVAAPFIRRK